MRALALLLLSLLLHFSVASDDTYVPMKIIAINKDGTLHPIFQQDLQNALKWFENTVRVERFKNPITLKRLTDALPSYQGVGQVTVTTPDRSFGFDLQSTSTDKLLEAADFVILLTQMDSARPEEAYSDMFGVVDGERPFGGNMQVKYRKHDLSNADYTTYYDIFRHEILHAMGYGVLKTADSTLPSETYEWENFDGTKVQANRHYFQYNNEKIRDAVKTHFNCDEEIKGIERDKSANHLNEYLFGDELMTPMVSYGENFFSWVSVEILEQLYTGDRPFYQVNRAFIAPEADAYNHLKGTGCTMLLGSCHTYAKTLPASPDPNKTFPFCTVDIPKQKQEEKWCYLNPKLSQPVQLYVCNGKSGTPGAEADNGVTEPAGSPFHDPILRFCPMFSGINSRHFEISEFKLCMDLVKG